MKKCYLQDTAANTSRLEDTVVGHSSEIEDSLTEESRITELEMLIKCKPHVNHNHYPHDYKTSYVSNKYEGLIAVLKIDTECQLQRKARNNKEINFRCKEQLCNAKLMLKVRFFESHL